MICKLCPRMCGTERDGSTSCHSGDELRIARAALHFWEEPPISGKNGSGAVFFTGCPLGCRYCQNYNISRGETPGRAVTPEELSGIFLDLIAEGAHNINLVTWADRGAVVFEDYLCEHMVFLLCDQPAF